MADEVSVKFGAEISALSGGLDSATGAITGATDNWKSKFVSVYESSTASAKQMVSGIAENINEVTPVVEAATATWREKFQSMFASVGVAAKGMTTNVATQAKESTEKLEMMSGAISKMRSTMMLLGEVAMLGFIGDKFFELAKKTAEYGHELELTKQKTAMNTTALQGWGVAAEMSGGSAETLVRATRKISMEMVAAQEGSLKAQQAFTKLGIAQEELKGMKLEDVMLRVADSFKQHADGAEKAALAIQLFGRAGLNLIPVFNQGSEGIKAWLKAAKDMGAIMSEDDVKAAAAFEIQLKMLHVATDGLTHKLGVALMPALSGLVGAMADSTKQGGQLNDIFSLMPGAFNMVASVVSHIAEAFQILGRRIAATAAILVEFLHGNFKNADRIKDEFNKDFEQITAASEKFRANLGKPIKMPKLQGEESEGKSKYDLAKPKDKSTTGAEENRVKEWEDGLEKIKIANKSFYGEMLEEDRNYWQQILDSGNTTAAERLSIEHKIFEFDKQIANEKLSTTMTGLRDQYNLAQHGSLERIDIARNEAKEIAATYGTQSRQYAQSLKEIDHAMKEFSDEQDKEAKAAALDRIGVIKTNGLLELDIEAEKFKHKKEMGLISAEQEEATLVLLENKKYAIEMRALQDQLKLYQDDVKNYEKTMTKIEEIAKKHELALVKIMKPPANEWNQWLQPMEAAFNKVFSDLISGNKKMSDSLKQAWNSMVSSWAGVLLKMAQKWIATRLQMLIFGKTADAQDLAAQELAVNKQILSQMRLLTANMTNQAAISAAKASALVEQTAATSIADVAETESLTAVAAMGAAASVASIPYVGPVLAAAAAASMEAMGQGYVAQAACAQGYDVPSGINPVAQLHQEEMVLPADIAKPLRDAIKGGGSGGGGGHSTYNIRALDAKSFKQFLSGNKGAIKGLRRNFAFGRG